MSVLLVLSYDSNHHALDEYIPLMEPHWLHGGVGRLQANPSAWLAVELLDGCFASVDQGDNHLAIFGGLFAVDDDNVPVHDVLIDHRGALNPKPVIGPSPGEHLLRDRDGFLMHQRLDGGAGCHLAQ